MLQNRQTTGERAIVRDLQGLPRSLIAFAADFPAGHVISPHFHPRAQLVHAASGVMTVTTATGSWVVPPGLGLWMPADMVHEVRAVTTISMRTLYIARDAAAWLPNDCRVVGVPPLLRELILRASSGPPLYDTEGPAARLMAVILDELRDLAAAPLHLPMPSDRRLKAVAEALLEAPDDNRGLTAWGRKVGASSRTLSRLFVSETGMTFGRWRQRRRLLAALERLAQGEAVTSVALDLGYASPSAFIAMFRRSLGASPTAYLNGSTTAMGNR